jgi:hypothetical protein
VLTATSRSRPGRGKRLGSGGFAVALGDEDGRGAWCGATVPCGQWLGLPSPGVLAGELMDLAPAQRMRDVAEQIRGLEVDCGLGTMCRLCSRLSGSLSTK